MSSALAKEDLDLEISDDESCNSTTATAATTERFTGVKGEVVRARRFGLLVSFYDEDGTTRRTAGLFPGRAYVNATHLLLDVCKSDQELQLLLPEGMEVNIDAVRASSCPTAPAGDGFKERCEYVITLLWVGEKPRESDFRSAKPPVERQIDFQERLAWIEKNVICPAPAKRPPTKAHESWFVKSLLLPSTERGLPHPDEATRRGQEGIVVELHRPDGGVVQLDDGTRVFFHRSRVFLDDMHLSATLDLSNFLPVDTRVTVDCAANDGDRFFRDCPAESVALLVYVGSRPDVPKIIFDDRLQQSGGEKYCIARILKFDPPGETGVESGLAEIVKPDEMSSISYARDPRKHLIDVDTEVTQVRFHRSKMFHLGMLLHKTDLRYIYSPTFGLDTLYCYVQPIENATGDDVKHEVALGWKNTAGALRFSPSYRADDTLLYPNIFSYESAMFCGKEGYDAEMLENIVEGLLPPRAQYFSGVEDVHPDFVMARVNDLFPPSHSKTAVAAGMLCIESGEREKSKAFFDRNAISAFGFKLDKTDLQYMLDQNEPVFAKVEKVEGGKDVLVKLKAKEVWLGWPYKKDQKLDTIPNAERHKLLLYLESKNLSVAAFLRALGGNCLFRHFIQFQKEENLGTIVSIDRGPQRQNRLLKKNQFPGAVGGVIQIDKGPLAGKSVSFNRKNTWVLGHNLAKADLTRILFEGQKVYLEAFEVPQEDDKGKNLGKKPAHKYSYRATIVWTSKGRPRHGFCRNKSESVAEWLKKRNLDWDKFQLLVEGKLPAVSSSSQLNSDSKKLPVAAAAAPEKTPATGVAVKKQPVTEKVFRHGNEAARICDMALSVTGPNDSRIKNIVNNDSNAQMAFHIYKTLGQALETYSKKSQKGRQSPWTPADLTEPHTFSNSTPSWVGQDSLPGGGRRSMPVGYGYSSPAPTPNIAAYISPWAGNSAGGGGNYVSPQSAGMMPRVSNQQGLMKRKSNGEPNQYFTNNKRRQFF